MGPAVQTLFAKKAKNEDCANRHVPSANDRFLIGTIIFPRSKHIDQCLSLLRSDQPFGRYSRKTKNKDCANRNRHVPSATDRLSTGTVIFPMSKHIDYCLSSYCLGPAVQTVFAKRLKIKCANCHVPSATNRISMGTVIFPKSKHIDQCLSLLRSDQPFGHYSRKG